jgi:hypothetical protein
MPSMRLHPLNPRLATPAPGSSQAVTSPAKSARAASTAPLVPVLPVPDEESAEVTAARAGGFHESSFELQHGLQVSESEWPDDVTMPGALGER